MFCLLSRRISLKKYGSKGPTTELCRHLSTAYSNQKTNETNRNAFESKKAIKPSGYDQLVNSFDNDIKRGGVVPVFKRSLLFANQIAVKDVTGEYTHRQILDASKHLAAQILANTFEPGCKVAFLTSNTVLYPVIKYAIWMCGHVSVPLSPRHPHELIRYFVEDSEATLIITTSEHEAKIKPVSDILRLNVIYVDHSDIPGETIYDPNEPFNAFDMNATFKSTHFYSNANAMMLYTSGSTGRPKGVVISHKNIQSQVTTLSNIWCINEMDRLLHVLPLNHVHGCVNALLCPLNVGAKVIMHPKFEATAVWEKLLNINAPSKHRITVFTAVPTIYSLLIAEYEKAFGKDDGMIEYVRSQCKKNIRLMMSGSAPLPTNVFAKWQEITGHLLLERYGMTETGMILSNPYNVEDRIPGTVGLVLPDASVRLVDDKQVKVEVKGSYDNGVWHSSEIANATNRIEAKNVVGELYVKGPSVFVEYFKKPDETKNAFENEWFKTGDVAEFKNGIFRILGRSNVDVIKTGAFKVSALEVETQLLEHPLIADVCVVGVPDEIFGQKIAALIVIKKGTQTMWKTLALPELRAWCEERIASYQIPSMVTIVDEIPRNAMGKVNKREIVRDFFPESTAKCSSP